MIFPIADLLDEQESIAWVEKYFHPKKLRCPGCGATTRQARPFRTHRRGFVDYRCQKCQRRYNLYTGAIFAGSNLAPRRVVLLVRDICKGEPATVFAEELALSRCCVPRWRKRIQPKAHALLNEAARADLETEPDEMLQNAGGKRRKARRAAGSAAASGA